MNANEKTKALHWECLEILIKINIPFSIPFSFE